MLHDSSAEPFTTRGAGQWGNSDTATEQVIEHRVSEIGRILRNAAPHRRDDLKLFAETLLNQETAGDGIRDRAASELVQSQRQQSPLAAGLLLLLFGCALMLISAPIGMTLAIIGLLLAIWGRIMSWRHA
jgi:hypothetical protein